MPWCVSRGSNTMFCSFFRSLKPDLPLTIFSNLSRYFRNSSSSRYCNDEQISINDVPGYLQSKIFTSFGLSIRILEGDFAALPNYMVTDIRQSKNLSKVSAVSSASSPSLFQLRLQNLHTKSYISLILIHLTHLSSQINSHFGIPSKPQALILQFSNHSNIRCISSAILVI